MNIQKAKKGSFLRRLLGFLGFHSSDPVEPAPQHGNADQTALPESDVGALDLESLNRLKRKVERRLARADGALASASFPLSGDSARRTLEAVKKTKEQAPELLSIFIDEAHEVLESIGEHLRMLRAKPGRYDHVVAIRRGFHTLKGSGRMIGLVDLGDVAWGMEQVFNRWLQLKWPATPALVSLIGSARLEFGLWVRHIESHAGNLQEGRELNAWVVQLERGPNAMPAVEHGSNAIPVIHRGVRETSVLGAEGSPELYRGIPALKAGVTQTALRKQA
jgi:HPt (histidine-containing phosphotransfer) domain-containing protein